jgi:ubiquinone/menaquinone biosynthesis C-methylase UbiE
MTTTERRSKTIGSIMATMSPASHEIPPLTQEKRGYINWQKGELAQGQYDNLLSHLANPDGKRILDIGCGPALVLETLVQGQSPTLVVGLDIDLEWLNYARKRLAQNGKVAFIQASAECLPFLSSSFDVVICTAVLPYLWNEKKALKELCRCLAPGGILFLRLHSIGNSLCRIFTRGKGALIHNTLSLVSSLVYQLTDRKSLLPSPDTHQSLPAIVKALRGQGTEIMSVSKSMRWLFMHRLFDVVARKARSNG